MNISGSAFIISIVSSALAGLIVGVGAGTIISKRSYESRIDEAEAMAELWKHRATENKVLSPYEPETNTEDVPPPASEKRIVKHSDHDYTKYYSRSIVSEDIDDTEDEEEIDVVSIHPGPDKNGPPRIVSQDEAMSPDVDCIELEYHTKDEALIDPNTPGKPDLIDEVDAHIMVGNLLRVPDTNRLPNTVYIYCPELDRYYEIYIYDNYWDPPEVEKDDDSPTVEKIRKRRFSDG